MAGATRVLGRLVYGTRYDRIPRGQRVYVRPGEWLVRELRWRNRLRTAEVITLDESGRGSRSGRSRST